MAVKTIMVDTSILIDFYRKTDKANSVWISLIKHGYEFSISVITKYEIYSGTKPSQLEFWNNVLQAIEVIPLDEASIDTAVAINTALKRKRKQNTLSRFVHCRHRNNLRTSTCYIKQETF